MILTTYAIFLIIREYTVSLELATQHIYNGFGEILMYRIRDTDYSLSYHGGLSKAVLRRFVHLKHFFLFFYFHTGDKLKVK